MSHSNREFVSYTSLPMGLHERALEGSRRPVATDRGNLVDLSELASVLGGRVLESGDAGFDEARTLWNARFDRRPDLIVRCMSSADVKASVAYARQHEMRLSVKGGGH